MNTSESMLSIEPDRIMVAVGLIFDENNRVLLGRRTHPDRYFGKWEFPGGKIRAGESVTEALHRELREEVGISVIRSTPFVSFAYDYPDRKVMLEFRLVVDYDGKPSALEQQDLRWVEISKLSRMDMLAPNVKVIEQLKIRELETRNGESGI